MGPRGAGSKHIEFTPLQAAFKYQYILPTNKNIWSD